MRGNSFKLKEGKLILDIRKKLFPVRVTRCWHRLPRAAVGAPSLGGQGQAGLGWEQPGLAASVPAHGRGWDWMVFKVPSNPNPSVI